MKIDQLHDILYDILCDIDDACKKENVSYSLGGGTMLGAVRHKDFIPWDDDIDLCIWYKDWPAMADALKKHLPEYYRVMEPNGLSPIFYDFVFRVQDTRYHWHPPTEEDIAYDNKQNYICADIFCVANSAPTVAGKALHVLLFKVLYGLAMGHRVNLDYSKYSLIKKTQVAVLAGIGRLIPMEWILRWQHKASTMYDDRKTDNCIVVNDLPHYLSLPYKGEWFKGTVDLPFRGRMMPVQTGYHEKLTMQYGDYMQPPKDRNAYIKHFEQN